MATTTGRWRRWASGIDSRGSLGQNYPETYQFSKMAVLDEGRISGEAVRRLRGEEDGGGGEGSR